MKHTWNLASFICAALLALGVMTFFKACGPAEDGTFMHCHDVQLCVFALGLCLAGLSLVLSFFSLFLPVRLFLEGAGLVLSAAAALLPGRLMPMCMMETMRCQALMKPFVTLTACLLAILFAVSLAGDLRKR